MRRIGIYGAAGFVGQHLVRRLSDAGEAVRAVSRSFDDAFVTEFRDRVEIVPADLMETEPFAATLQGVDTVIQLISTSTPGLQNERELSDIRENILPQVAFLRRAVDQGVKRFIFLSSGGVIYGPGAPVPTPEDAPTRPVCSYGITKLAIEAYIRMHAHVDGLDHVILRVSNLYGPGQIFRRAQGLIPAALHHMERGTPLPILGDGGALRDYVHIDDVIDALDKAVTLAGPRQLVVNIGSGQTRSIIEVIETIEQAYGRPLAREHHPARRTDLDVSCLDITQASEVLGWRPRTDFRDGITRLVADRQARRVPEAARKGA